MSQDNPGILHDATNSWNGYNHQGKIALYFAMKKITELIKAGADKETNEAVLGNYFLEVEYTEDFSIGTIGAGGELYYQTIHQVKDRKDTTLNRYKSAIQGLAVNMVRHPEIEAAYLHTTKKVSDEQDKTFKESVRDMIEDMSWIPEQRIKAEAKQDPKKRQEALDWLAKVENDLPGISGDAQKLGKIQKYSYEMSGDESRNYCPKDAAKDYVHMSLRGFYEKHDPDKAYRQGDDFIKKSYQYALEKLNEHVVFRAMHYSDKTVQRYIPLSDLYDWLVSDEIENMGEDYYLYHIKEGYFGYIEEFCATCKLERCGMCRVPAFKGRFRCMKPKELKQFVRQTNPNVPGAIAIEQYHKFLQKNGIRDPFWAGLRKITQEPNDLQKNNAVKYVGSDDRTYILTTLMADQASEEDDEFAQEEAAEEVKLICTEIYKNQNESELDMGGSCLLSRNIDVESVQEHALTINPRDICSNRNSIIASRRISIVKVSDFRKRYMRKEYEEV